MVGIPAIAIRRMVILTVAISTSFSAFAQSEFNKDRNFGPEYALPAELTPSVARSDFGMVATGSPEATRAAVEILERGGNAIDASVAAALMLTVSDPSASGLGGMTYMVIHLATGRTFAIDGSPPTPRAVEPGRLQELKDAGKLLGHELVAVPTTLAVLESARSRYGTMSLSALLEPAIETAENGYELSPMQIISTNKYFKRIVASDSVRPIAMQDGATTGRPGDLICRPILARVLRQIAREGTASFYRGSIADVIEADMIENGGFLRKSDLAMLRVREVRTLLTTYRGTEVHTFPPPGGGATLIEILNILGNFPSELMAENSVARHHVATEAYRIADSDRFLGSTSSPGSPFAPPLRLSPEHARLRAQQIVPDRAIPVADLQGPLNPECGPSGDSTTQVSVADQWGNVVSLTQTIGRSYGAEVATPSLDFPYNSLLENFNFDKPQCPGYLQPLIPCPNDMAPTLVFAKDGTLVAALGSPGSNRIPSMIVGVISNLVDRGMALDQAIEAPRALFGGIPKASPMFEIEAPITEEMVDSLESMGLENVERYYYPPEHRRIVVYGGVNAIGWDARTGTFIGVGDSRRYGSALGPRVVVQPVVAD